MDRLTFTTRFVFSFMVFVLVKYVFLNEFNIEHKNTYLIASLLIDVSFVVVISILAFPRLISLNVKPGWLTIFFLDVLLSTKSQLLFQKVLQVEFYYHVAPLFMNLLSVCFLFYLCTAKSNLTLTR